MLPHLHVALTLLSAEPLWLFGLSDVDVIKKKGGGAFSFYPALINDRILPPLTLAAVAVGGAQLP